MDESIAIRQKMIDIIESVCKRKVSDFDKNLFGRDIDISSREMAYIFLKIEKMFCINLNELISVFDNHSVNGLLENISTLMLKR
ncbi:MAG: hypothetical protein LBC56_00220 [Oscillospiraceae bacterium]|jgi:acyl carrier protein|nr:hypothetical protein [Oscillospiraceae bacterium]